MKKLISLCLTLILTLTAVSGLAEADNPLAGNWVATRYIAEGEDMVIADHAAPVSLPGIASGFTCTSSPDCAGAGSAYFSVASFTICLSQL